MNILIITRYNNDGGVVTHVINLANELMNRGNTVVVSAPLDDNGKKGRYDKLNCIFEPVNFEEKNFVKVIRKLQAICDRYNIKIIHSHNRNTSLYAQYLKLKKRIPFIWTLHQDNIPIKFPYKQLTFSGNKTIAVSSELKDFCVNKLDIPQDNIEIIYNGVYEDKYVKSDNKNIRERYGVKTGETVIVLLARLEKRKGHLMLLEAMTLLRSTKAIKVLITGTNLDNGEYRRELDKFISARKLEDQVCFVGYVNPVEILSISDAMALPSEKEGEGIAVIESFLMRVPVIRTKTGGYEETKEFCVGIENAHELASAIELVLNDKEKISRMAEKAYSFAINNCTVDVMTSRVEKIYKELIDK